MGPLIEAQDPARGSPERQPCTDDITPRGETLNVTPDAPQYIYALTGPNGVPRYVGRSADPWQRLTNHCSAFAARPIREWVDELRARGEKPTLIVLYRVEPGDDADAWERRFISLLGTTSPLLNATGRLRRMKNTHARSVGAIALRAAMRSRKLSQSYVCDAVGVSHSGVVSRWLSGERKPSRECAVKLRDLYGIPIADWDRYEQEAAA